MKLNRLVNSFIPNSCAGLLFLMVSFIFSQIVGREIFNFSLNWSDEGSQFCMMWMVLLGSIYLTKYDRHLNTGLKLHRKLNERLVALIDGILALATVVSAAVVAYQSAIFSFSGFKAVSLPWLNMMYVYIALPIFMLAFCYYYLKSFFKNLVLFFKKVPRPDMSRQSKG
jgi:TRAP-type C4-dicarboxylate transport system permease small subunit